MFSLCSRGEAFFLSTMYVFVLVCVFLYVGTTMMSSSIYVPRAHNITVHQPCTRQQSKYMPIRARQCEPADRVGESQHLVEHSYSSPCFQKERRHRNLPGLKKTKLFVIVGALGISNSSVFYLESWICLSVYLAFCFLPCERA